MSLLKQVKIIVILVIYDMLRMKMEKRCVIQILKLQNYVAKHIMALH